jgi:hypothetical protein
MNRISILLLIETVLLAQGASTEPIAWVRDGRFTKGKWIDVAHANRPLKPGDAIFSDSKLLRLESKSGLDKLSLNLPDGQPYRFDCAKPQVCDGPLDLTSIIAESKPRMSQIYGRVINTISGSSRGSINGGLSLRDTVLSFRSSGIPAAQVINFDTRPGTYELAWCGNALEETCSAEPHRFTVKWLAKAASDEVLLPTRDLEPGLHRLVGVTNKQGDWLYSTPDAWILMVQPDRFEGVEARYKNLVSELQGFPKEEQSQTRALIITFLATQTK